MPPPPDLGTLSFAEIERLAADDAWPPVERWNPDHCGDSRMHIASDGRWYHDGAPIKRPELVRLFARILRREADGSYALVTPHEKLTIAVDDTPFFACDVRMEGTGRAARLAFALGTGEIVVAGAEHPLRVTSVQGAPRPHLAVRQGLEAVISRPVYYRLADLAVSHRGVLGIWSSGVFFALEPAT